MTLPDVADSAEIYGIMDGYRLKSCDDQPAFKPYNDLYIYYIQGHIKSEYEHYSDDFIGNWEEDEFSFLFFSRPSDKVVEKILSTNPQLAMIDSFYMKYDEWQGGALTPMTAGSFLILPPWGKKELRTREYIDILLDPGVVFGTGTHTTTNDCIHALELAFSLNTIESVIDLGTGTGLLSLAAAKLGCKKIIAVDFNQLAVKTALNNIVLNRLEGSILALRGRAEDFICCPADFLIANIHYDIIKQLIDSKGFLEKKMFILSGMLRSQAKDISFRLSKLPVEIINIWEHDGIWHTFLGKIS